MYSATSFLRPLAERFREISFDFEVSFFSEELLARKSTKIEWLKTVFAGDVLKAKATVTNLTKRSEKNGIVEVTIEAYNANGELVLTDVTEAIVKNKL